MQCSSHVYIPELHTVVRCESVWPVKKSCLDCKFIDERSDAVPMWLDVKLMYIESYFGVKKLEFVSNPARVNDVVAECVDRYPSSECPRIEGTVSLAEQV